MFTLPDREGTLFALTRVEEDGSAVTIRVFQKEERDQAMLLAAELELKRMLTLSQPERWRVYRREVEDAAHFTPSSEFSASFLSKLMALAVARRVIRCYKLEKLA
jgi:hypothetical protein